MPMAVDGKAYRYPPTLNSAFLPSKRPRAKKKARWEPCLATSFYVPSVWRTSRALHPETPATFASAMDAAISATLSPRFDECARELRQTIDLLLRECVPSRLPDQSAS